MLAVRMTPPKNVQNTRKAISKKRRTSNRHLQTQISALYEYNCLACWKKFPSKFTCDLHKQRKHLKDGMGICKIEIQHDESPYVNCEDIKIEPCFAIKSEAPDSEEIPEGSEMHPPIEQVMLNCDEICDDKSALNLNETDGLCSHKDFECSICERKFDEIAALRTHYSKAESLNNTCPHCCKRFMKRGGLGLHLKTHGDIPNKCHVCGKEFRLVKHLKEHYKYVHGDREFSCELCGRKFSRKQALILHLRVHGGENSHACEHCNARFTHKATLTRHYLRKHKKNEKVQQECDHCKQRFPTLRKLRVHMRTHGERPFRCKQCAKSFRRQSALESHILFVHTSKEKYKHVCQICGKRFARRQALQNHARTHTGEKPYVCQTCGHQFTKQGSLAQHVSRIHTSSDKYPFACDRCPLKFINQKRQRIHLKTHSATPYECKECGKQFQRPNSLSSHILFMHTQREHYKYACEFCDKKFAKNQAKQNHERTHTGEKPFTCDICNRMFTQKGTLTAHYVRMHTSSDSYNFVCEHCNQRFFNKRRLTIHQKVHGNSQYKCHLCEKEFLLESSLNTHVIFAHTDAEGYGLACEVCNKRFPKREHLDNHMRSHTGEKPFTCDVCQTIFKRQSTLKAHHLTQHTPVSSWQHSCEQCGKKYPTRNKLNIHIMAHILEKVSCHICDMKFESRDKLTHHISSTHTNPDVSMCKFCNEQFHSKDQYEAHLETHSDENTSCSLCGEKFKLSVQLKVHILHMHSNSGPMQYHCEHCGKVYPTHDKLRKHWQMHKAEKPCDCLICGLTFKFEKTLKNHMLVVHSDSNSWEFSCELCNKKFVKKHNLTVHMRTHTGEKPFVCPHCDRKFRFKHSLKEHVSQNHTDSTCWVHNCDVCGEKFATEKILKCHLRKHVDKEVQCDSCELKFKLKSALREHTLFVHTDADTWQFVCEYCGKKFPREDTMKVHIRTHTNEKPYHCEGCDQKFGTSYLLKVHSLQTHTSPDKWRFRCDYCEKKFPVNEKLQKHLISHVAEKFFRCPNCEKAFKTKKSLADHLCD